MTAYLSELYTVKRRYQRSIQVPQDWISGNGLEGYLLTPKAKQITEQILLGIKSIDYPTAWTITGPYGTGKSAYALFLTDLLANDEPNHNDARNLKNDLLLEQKPFIPILIQGQRNPLNADFLDALMHSFEIISPSFHKELEELKNSWQDNRGIVQLFEKATLVAQKLDYGGILVIVDEFGKYLEFAANNIEDGDLLIMQDLAETASRSDYPFILITILHSAFADYLSVVDETKRAEWQKVQGRYADISFIEPGEQFLKLIGAALQADQKNKNVSDTQQKARQIVQSPAYNEARRRLPLDELIPNCVPLHPITALLLWPLFRSTLSQNERSLFSFLNDYSPHGFQEFLARTEVGISFYHISDLYDYIHFTIGDSVLLSLQARRWAEIANAINRIEVDAPNIGPLLIKSIGLINLFGNQVGIKASRELLITLFEDAKAVTDAIDYLEKKSIIIFRKFEGSYGIWEGSDVDLEVAYNRAQIRANVGNFAQRFMKLIDLQPIVARAHYVQTGTMRYFDVGIVDGGISDLDELINQDIRPSDGKVFFVLSKNRSERDKLINKIIERTSKVSSQAHLKVFALPKPLKGLEEALSNLDHWKWVKDNTPELAGDRVARQEVQAQIRIATRKLLDIAGETFGLRGYLFTPSDSIWIQDGNIFEHQSSIEFQRWLSSLCTKVFHSAPSLFNELLNRENISSAAAAIRRNLIQIMLENDGIENLGFVGTPPEYSMYRSLLENGGFYRIRSSGEFSFAGLPSKEWRPVWYAMRNFLSSTVFGRRPLIELYEILKLPPFGLREGPIPVLICALILAYKDRVALYEEGRFIPEIRIEILELLIKVPESFEIQFYELSAETKEAFIAVGEVLEQLNIANPGHPESINLLEVIKPLVIFAARLPDYTKKTKNLHPIYAIEVRDELIKARDPYTLLFEKLPKTLEVSLTTPKGINKFAARLRESLLSLRQAYPNLLNRVEENFREAFGKDKGIKSVDLRDEIVQRAAPLSGYTPDPTLKLFLRETQRINNRDWREVLGRAVNQGLPTNKWHDHSVVDFQLRLIQLASDFKRLESLVREMGKVENANIALRLSVLHEYIEEKSIVVLLTPEMEAEIHQLVENLEKELETSNVDLEVKFAALGKLLDVLLTDNGNK